MFTNPVFSARRRRLLTVAAVAGLTSGVSPLVKARQHPDLVSTWRGSALGAPASMQLVHPDRDWAHQTISRCVAEIERLESIFSIYRQDSVLSRLNQAGQLDHPPFELLEVLSFSLALARQSEGAFDPTIQPLYALLARHFSQAGASPSGPTAERIASALNLVDYRQIETSASLIRLQKPDMALTLNGVAQGYITDKVGELLQEAGFDNILIDVGEIIGRGRRADGQAWKAGVALPDQAEHILFKVELGQGAGQHTALATSSGLGTRFARGSAYHHLLDPHTGQSASHHAAVSVAADRAMIADGLSTALSVASPLRAPALLTHWPRAQAWFTASNGQIKSVPVTRS